MIDRQQEESEMQHKDWEFLERKAPEDPEQFESMFTNNYGERWYSRIFQDDESNHQIVIWGDDVDQVVVSRTGKSVSTLPWIMDSAETLWFHANLKRLRDRPISAAWHT